MGGGCTFIRLLADEDKGVALRDAIDALQNGEGASAVFSIAPEKFSMVPGSPFAYWVSDRIRRLFVELPPFEGNGRTIKQGLATADDFRFVRAWWEVDPARTVTGTAETTPDEFRAQTCAGKKWVPFAKGGEYSPYYADVHLVVNWGNDGEELREFPRAYIRNEGCYFRPGLTWPKLPLKRGAFSYIPPGVIFSHGGMMIFAPQDQLWALISLLNTDAYIGLLHLLMPRGVGNTGATLKYEVGYIKSVPIPELPKDMLTQLEDVSKRNWELMRLLQTSDELSYNYIQPAITENKNLNLEDSSEILDKLKLQKLNEMSENATIANEIGFLRYELGPLERTCLCENIGKPLIPDSNSNEGSNGKTDSITAELLSWCTGAIFGRWDVRYATGEREPPELPDPFAPLPACSPGMLQGEDGLPLDPHEIPPDYPLAVDPDGILVDDEGHPDDIIARIRDVLALIWGDRADAIEKEACEILGVKSLRDYFRKPSAGGFWDDHVKRYSKSRRKAPIYWLLQSAKKNYGIWIYYPRMDGDTLYKALRYAKDKLAMEARRLEDLRKEREQSGTGGAAVKKLEKEIDSQEAFVSELNDFVEKLERAANLDLIPEHDDGVVLTIAPLRELVPWNEPKNYWDELIEGKYAWSSIGKQLAEKGLVKV